MALPPFDDPCWRDLAHALAEAHHAALVRRWREAQHLEAAKEADAALERLRLLEHLSSAPSGVAPKAPVVVPRTGDGETLH